MTNDIEKWLSENTRKCPLGRVTREMCARLRARPRIKEASDHDLVQPLACLNCDWKKYFAEQERLKKAA